MLLCEFYTKIYLCVCITLEINLDIVKSYFLSKNYCYFIGSPLTNI